MGVKRSVSPSLLSWTRRIAARAAFFVVCCSPIAVPSLHGVGTADGRASVADMPPPEPALLQTTWFYLVAGAALGLLVYGGFAYRTRRLRERERELLALVEERTAKLRAEVEEHARAQEELQQYRTYLEQLVTERTAELQESNAQLQREIAERRSSEERYRRFFNEDLAGAFIASASGVLLTYNPSFSRIFGVPGGQEGLVRVDELFEDPAEPAKLAEEIKFTHQIQNREVEMKAQDGRRVTVIANLIGSFSEEGELQEVKGYVMDATQQKQLQQQLTQSQKMEAIGQLAGGIAHDFNNLLTAIIGSSECLLEDKGSSSEARRFALEIRDAGQRAADLTRQLLSFSRKQVLQPRPLNLNQVVREMEAMLRRLIGENIRFSLNLSEELRTIRADPTQIQQVVLNLVVNARDAMPHGGDLQIETAQIHLQVSLQQNEQTLAPGPYARLTVADSGTGMSPEVQAHVFEPFFTTKSSGQGTGLGLSMIYGIVQQNNGFITFSSTEGQGTSFQVYLPVVEDGTEAPVKHPTRSPFVARGETLLLVEDNELVLTVAQRSLEQVGFEVLAATDGTGALQHFAERQGKIDLMITDMIMPDINGRELAARVRATYGQVRVLFISGYTGETLTRLGDFTDPLLEKPFTSEVLIRRVCEVLDDAPESGL